MNTIYPALQSTRLPSALKRLCVCLLVGVLVQSVGVARADSGLQHRGQSVLFGTSGSSIEHVIERTFAYCYTGTLGALLKDAGNNTYILSNNHVLAKENNPDYASLPADGYDIIQPGLLDQSTCNLNDDHSASKVGRLAAFVPLNFNGTRKRPAVSVADAAIATNGGMAADGEIMDIGRLTGSNRAVGLGETVQKSGRTTGRTFGNVKAIDVTVDVQYSSGISRFNGQMEIVGLCGTLFSDSGDSGSLIVTVPDGTGPRTGTSLLFAGGGSSTFANPLAAVFDALASQQVSGLEVVHDGSGNADDISGNSAIPVCSDGGGGGGKPGKGNNRAAVDPIGLQIAKQVLQRNSRALFAMNSVLGHGIGASDQGASIRVYVESMNRRAGPGIPVLIEGVPVEVVVTGPIKAY